MRDFVEERITDSKAFYYNDLGKECTKDEATNMLIVNYDSDGNEIGTVRAFTKNYDPIKARVTKEIDLIKNWMASEEGRAVLPKPMTFDQVELFRVTEDGDNIYFLSTHLNPGEIGHKSGLPFLVIVEDGIPDVLNREDRIYFTYHGKRPSL